MQTMAFLWFELQVAQQCLPESFAESQVPAKAGMASWSFSERENLPNDRSSKAENR
jgi:hypothetical protein